MSPITNWRFINKTHKNLFKKKKTMIITIIFFVLKETNKFENAKNIILFEKKYYKRSSNLMAPITNWRFLITEKYLKKLMTIYF